MERSCVLVADRTRARIFTLTTTTDKHDHFRLAEKVDLVNRWLHASYEGRRDGRRADIIQRFKVRCYSGHDHKRLDDDYDDKKFSKEINQELLTFMQEENIEQLIIVAPPQFLGALREHQDGIRREASDIKEIPKELSRLSSPEICRYLEKSLAH